MDATAIALATTTLNVSGAPQSIAAGVAAAPPAASPADAPTKPGKQGRGRRLTDKERMEIIEMTRANPRIKHVELAMRYNVNESTIRKWRITENAEKIETRYKTGAAGVRDSRQRGQVVQNEKFDAALLEWIATQRAQNLDVTLANVQTKALELATDFDGMHTFKASSGWYYRFCRRYDLPCPTSTTTRTYKARAPRAPKMAASVIANATRESGHNDAYALDTTKANYIVVDSVGAHAIDTTDDPSDIITYDASPASSTVTLKRKIDDTLAGNNNSDDTEDDDQSIAVELIRDGDETSAVLNNPVAHVPIASAIPVAHVDNSYATVTPARRPMRASYAAAATGAMPTPTPSSAPATSAPPATTAASIKPELMSPPSVRQEAIAHFQQHHKHLLSVRSRLQFIKHLAHSLEDAEMYLVMDDDTRIEFIKEFIDKGTAAPLTQAV